MLVRVAECAGGGALAACAAAAVLVPLLLWQGQPAFVPALFLLALGATAGLGWGVAHRPTRLAAATEADRQLALSDLLGTASAVPHDTADPWLRTVLALADERCRRHAPSQVLLNRFGARAWGGIGLAAALVLTLAALTSHPSGLRAGPSRGGGGRLAATRERERSEAAAALRPPPAARPPLPGPQRPGDAAAQDPMSSPGRTKESAEPGGRAAPNGRSSASTDDGRGGGAGRARAPRAADAPSSDSAPRGAARNDPSAPPTTGSGRMPSSGSAPAGPDGGGTAAGSGSPPQRLPPWQSDSWPADARAAEDAVTAGRVPDAYRDLVREYFRRD